MDAAVTGNSLTRRITTKKINKGVSMFEETGGKTRQRLSLKSQKSSSTKKGSPPRFSQTAKM